MTNGRRVLERRAHRRSRESAREDPGSGGLGSPTDYDIAPLQGPTDVAVGDLDHDGAQDVVTATTGLLGLFDTAFLWANLGVSLLVVVAGAVAWTGAGAAAGAAGA